MRKLSVQNHKSGLPVGGWVSRERLAKLDEAMGRQETAIIPEHSVVRLKIPVAGWPAGTRGTVVHQYRYGLGYEVEFTRPGATGVLTVRPSDIEAEEIERLQAALVLLKKIEDALSKRLIEPDCGGWGPLYQEIADFLDPAQC